MDIRAYDTVIRKVIRRSILSKKKKSKFKVVSDFISAKTRSNKDGGKKEISVRFQGSHRDGSYKSKLSKLSM